MPARPGQPKADAGHTQKNPHGKPALRVVAPDVPTPVGTDAPTPPVDPEVGDVEPLYHTYDQPKPEGAWFDEESAERAVNFITRLAHFQGKFAGTAFALLPWQLRLVREIFGWMRADGTRLYRLVYVECARKSGKSTIASAIGLYLAYGDSEPGAQVVFAAADRDQAKVCYSASRIMAEQAQHLADITTFYNSSNKMVVQNNPGTELRALSADTKKLYGLNLHGLIFDELMTQPNRVLWDALTTAQGSRVQPLIFAITTAGWDRQSIAYEQHEYTRKIHEGGLADPSFLGVVFGAAEDEDWTDPAAWRKANPSLGHTVGTEYYAEKCAQAMNQPTAQNSFRTLLLSQWVGQATRFIPMDAWDQCGLATPPPLTGRRVFGGLDLSSTTDLTAFVMVGRDDTDGTVAVEAHIFVPEDDLRERGLRDRAPYEVWADQGYIHLTPGKAVDYDFVRKTVLEARAAYKLEDVSYDRWGANETVTKLTHEGVRMISVGQGYVSLSAPTKELLRLLAEGQIQHGNHPVLRWMADGAAGQTDAAGNVKLAKDRSTTRIDGLVALVMALDGLTRRGLKRRSVYEDRGMVTV